MTNSHDNQTMKNNVHQYNKTQEGSELQKNFPHNKTVDLEMAESARGKYRREATQIEESSGSRADGARITDRHVLNTLQRSFTRPGESWVWVVRIKCRV